jgi:MFS family permease
VWNDASLRVCFMYWALGSFVAGGTMQVALPVLAGTRLDGGAALGLMMGLHGAGALVGMALAGTFGKLRLGTFGATLLTVDALVGALLIALGWVGALWQAAGLMLVIGVFGGFLQVAIFSWIQQRVPRPMLGRIMSIFMFFFMGLAPMAAAIAGALLKYVSLTSLFVGAGAVLLAAAGAAFLLTPMAKVTDAPSIG